MCYDVMRRLEKPFQKVFPGLISPGSFLPLFPSLVDLPSELLIGSPFNNFCLSTLPQSLRVHSVCSLDPTCNHDDCTIKHIHIKNLHSMILLRAKIGKSSCYSTVHVSEQTFTDVHLSDLYNTYFTLNMLKV